MHNQTFQDQNVFRLLDWILRYTLFHGFDTLGSHLREEGSLDYDGGLVRLQVQTDFDMTINRQQPSNKKELQSLIDKIKLSEDLYLTCLRGFNRSHLY
jgi:hypothetical protein